LNSTDTDSAAHKRLVVYLMAGDDTPLLAQAAVEGGADLIEVGFPFSDPLADGPVIRRAAERALQQGMRTRRCLEVLARTSQLCVSTPLVPMTYSSLFEAYGWERLRDEMRAAGATSVIVADLPADERRELRRIQLVAPTTSDERVRLAASLTDGWLYLVTVTGVTGARDALAPQLPDFAARVRGLSDVPVYAGFGIATPEQAQKVGSLVDGIVVGSRAIEVAEQGPTALRDYVRSLRAALDGIAKTAVGPTTNEAPPVGATTLGGNFGA
jgi:tryptophan synthase alpha chain